MQGKIIHFPSKRSNKMKKIDVPTLKLVLKHHRLIANARKRKYSALAIAKLIVSAEESLR